MELLELIFTSFWTWLGFIILIAAAGGAVADIIKAARAKKKIDVYKYGGRWRVELEGAGCEEIDTAIQAIISAANDQGAEDTQ